MLGGRGGEVRPCSSKCSPTSRRTAAACSRCRRDDRGFPPMVSVLADCSTIIAARRDRSRVDAALGRAVEHYGLALHRLTDARDGRADFLLRHADRRLRVPYGLVDLAFGLQLVIPGQVADGLLALAFDLVDLSIALILIPHDRLQSFLAFRRSPEQHAANRQRASVFFRTPQVLHKRYPQGGTGLRTLLN